MNFNSINQHRPCVQHRQSISIDRDIHRSPNRRSHEPSTAHNVHIPPNPPTTPPSNTNPNPTQPPTDLIPASRLLPRGTPFPPSPSPSSPCRASNAPYTGGARSRTTRGFRPNSVSAVSTAVGSCPPSCFAYVWWRSYVCFRGLGVGGWGWFGRCGWLACYMYNE